MATDRCVRCGLIIDCDWVENPTNDYTCDRNNTPHEIVPLYWVRNMPGDRLGRVVDSEDQAIFALLESVEKKP